jgi:hypothetical protein
MSVFFIDGLPVAESASVCSLRRDGRRPVILKLLLTDVQQQAGSARGHESSCDPLLNEVNWH